MPPEGPTPEEDEALFADDPWIEGPVRIDYGFNVKSDAYNHHQYDIKY